MTWGSIWPKVGFRISGLGFSVEGCEVRTSSDCRPQSKYYVDT